ncbi:MAG: ATP-binding cassette domain-containing protein [Lawsonella clevelandensis]
MAASNGIPMERVDECLDLVGLTEAANNHTRSYSMGMRQRLGMAEAMLGNPSCLLFDEPINGLDPEGIAWFRHFAKSLAAEGRAILVSSTCSRKSPYSRPPGRPRPGQTACRYYGDGVR